MNNKQFEETNLLILIFCDMISAKVTQLQPVKTFKDMVLAAMLTKLNTICERVSKYYCNQYFGEQLELEAGEYFDRAHDHLWDSFQEFIREETKQSKELENVSHG